MIVVVSGARRLPPKSETPDSATQPVRQLIAEWTVQL